MLPTSITTPQKSIWGLDGIRQMECRTRLPTTKPPAVPDDGGEHLYKPIKKLAVQLQSNKGTFIIQLGTCHGFTKGKTSNLRLRGEDATARRQENKWKKGQSQLLANQTKGYVKKKIRGKFSPGKNQKSSITPGLKGLILKVVRSLFYGTSHDWILPLGSAQETEFCKKKKNKEERVTLLLKIVL